MQTAPLILSSFPFTVLCHCYAVSCKATHENVTFCHLTPTPTRSSFMQSFIYTNKCSDILLSFIVNTWKCECVSRIQNEELKYNIKISDDFVTKTECRLTYLLAYMMVRMMHGMNNVRFHAVSNKPYTLLRAIVNYYLMLHDVKLSLVLLYTFFNRYRARIY